MTQPTSNRLEDQALDRFYRAEAELYATADAEQEHPKRTHFHLPSYITGLLTALVLVGGMNLLLRRPEAPAIVLQPPPTAAPTATALPTATPAPIVVFISGAVQQPGMYTLADDARVGDALAAAGGLTLQANTSLVNQAERLWDGAQVHVPFVTTTSNTATQPTNATDTTSPAALQLEAAPPAGISGSATALSGRSNLSSENSDGLISINRASPTALETLPGIGASKAAAIVANRPYSTIEDLERVPGIGAKTIEQLRPMITVD
ncbi:MAG: ComEA family DNA-binding protein [Caldilineaceae bacterium]